MKLLLLLRENITIKTLEIVRTFVICGCKRKATEKGDNKMRVYCCDSDGNMDTHRKRRLCKM